MIIPYMIRSFLIAIFSLIGTQVQSDISIPFESSTSFQFLTFDNKTLEGIERIPLATDAHSRNEKRIVQIINTLSQGDLVKATRLAQALTRTEPNYVLAQLLYADLLRLHVPTSESQGTSEADVLNRQLFSEVLASRPESVSASQLELMLRLKALQSKPMPDMVPSHIVSIGNQYRQLVVADTKLGRISIFDIKYSINNPKFVLKHSFFMTIGDQGPGKQVEGDKKTPLGIYRILNRIPQNILTDLYGSGALNINYPNPVDRALGRTGFGIWFHGSPSATYVRAPFSSDGCLVLSNNDMNAMLLSTTPQQTLVIVDDGIEWQSSKNLIKPSQSSEHPVRKKLAQLIEKSIIISSDFNSREFYDGGAKWEYRLLRLVQSNKTVKPNFKINNITLIDWTRETPYTMVEFDFQLNPQSALFRFRQYWMNKEGSWKIIQESLI